MQCIRLCGLLVFPLLAVACQTSRGRPPLSEAATHRLASEEVPAQNSGSGHQTSGFLDFNVYPYTEVDGDNSFTLNALANLREDLQYFSFTNYARDGSRSELEETNGYLTEQNLRWMIPHTGGLLQAVGQAFLRSGVDNDALRFGVRWKVHGTPGLARVFDAINLQYWVGVHPIQLDHVSGTQWQFEHVYRMNVLPALLDDRVYIGGFADHNINHESGALHEWVQEAQLGCRVYDNYYLVAEQRYNGYRNGNESSFAVGVEYVVRF